MQLARIHGTFIERVETASDQLARTGIEWTRVIIRLPDDGTGALPVIRHIILKDSKSSTYKLALLRVLARIAECSLGLTRSANEEYVAVPLGLVAVFWLRQFKPVLQAGLPQMPTNVGLDGLGFVKDAYRRITHLSHLDFRVAARFTGQSALFLHQAINDVVSNIKIMPAKHTSFPNGPRVYGITSGHRIRLARELVLDSDYLKSFGELLVPEPIWRALTRFNVWIEPALVAEWIRIMKDYMTTQGRPVAEETFYLATRWSDPERDVRVARELALDLLKRDRLFCVWTGKKLKEIPWTLITAFLGPPGHVETSGIYCRRYDPLIKIRNPMVCRLLNVSPRRKKVSLIGGPPVIRTMRMRSLANAFGQRRRHPYQGS